jgi:hypothetical protein
MNQQQYYQFLGQLEIAKGLFAKQMEYNIRQIQVYHAPEINVPSNDLPIGLELDIDDVLNSLSQRDCSNMGSNSQPKIIQKKGDIPKEPEVAIHTFNMERVADEKEYISKRKRATQRQIAKRERVGTLRNATGKQVHFFTYNFENSHEWRQKRKEDDNCNIQ